MEEPQKVFFYFQNMQTIKEGFQLYILEDFENASLYFCIFALFLQTVYAIEKLLAGFNVQPRIGI